jgi:hypothetical protein
MNRYLYMSVLLIWVTSHAMDSEKKELVKKESGKGERRWSLPKLFTGSKNESSSSSSNSPQMSKGSFHGPMSPRKSSFNDKTPQGRFSPRVSFNFKDNETYAVSSDAEEKEGSLLSPRGQSPHIHPISPTEVKMIVARAEQQASDPKQSTSSGYYIGGDKDADIDIVATLMAGMGMTSDEKKK